MIVRVFFSIFATAKEKGYEFTETGHGGYESSHEV